MASVVVVHGFGEHGEGLPYRLLREHLEGAGFCVKAPDLPGHGKAPGPRGYIERWEEFREAVVGAAAELPAPVALVGLSMGGLVALEAALRCPERFAAVVCGAPPMGEIAIPRVFYPLAATFSRVWPRFGLSSRLNVNAASRDTAAMEEYLRDPLFHQRGTARFFAELLRARAFVHERARAFPLPLLILQGTDDRICRDDGGFYENCRAPRKQLKAYPEARHHLFLEANRDEIYADISRWLRETMLA